MSNQLTKNEGVARGAIRMIGGNKPSLAMQHLEYCLTINQNRTILAQHAMDNTEILMDAAREMAAYNPASAGALKEIMEAYLDATTTSIRNYGNPHQRNR